MKTSNTSDKAPLASQEAFGYPTVCCFTAAFVLQYCRTDLTANQISIVEDILYAYFHQDWDKIEELLAVKGDQFTVPISSLVRTSMRVTNSLQRERKLSRRPRSTFMTPI